MDVELTTVVFETINFLVLTLLLWRLLYRPLRESIATRRALVQADLAHAEQARAEADRLDATWRAREDELEALRARTRREALDDAERERARILARAREEAAQEHARVSQLLESEHEAAARWVRSAVWSRGTELAGRMMLALAPEHLDRALWDRLLDVIAQTSEMERESPEVEVCGARMAERPELDALRGALEGRLAGAPKITVREDSDLIAGWTIRIGDRLFDASIAGELEAFRDLARALGSDEAA